MKTCKVKPSASECRMCADTTDYFDEIPKCSQCGYKTIRYELISITTGFLTDYAFVQRNGEIIKVALDRIFDIREEENNV